MTNHPKQKTTSASAAGKFEPPRRRMLGHPDGKFPVFSPRGDMQNPLYLYMPGHLSALARHFGNPETTIVLGEVHVGWNVRRRRGLRIPDLMIAFGVDWAGGVENNGDSIDALGKPPDFVALTCKAIAYEITTSSLRLWPERQAINAYMR